MEPLGPGQGILNLNVGLHRVGGQKGSPTLQASELRPAGTSDRNIGQASRVLGYIQAFNSQRGGRLVTIIRLKRKRIGARISGTKFIDHGRAEYMRFVDRQPLGNQCRVLNTGYVRSQVKVGGGGGRGGQAAGALSTDQRVGRSLNEALVAEAPE